MDVGLTLKGLKNEWSNTSFFKIVFSILQMTSAFPPKFWRDSTASRGNLLPHTIIVPFGNRHCYQA